MNAEDSAARRIAVFTGTRADYGLLRRVLRLLAAREDRVLQLIVGGSHLSRGHGYTLDEIEADGLTPAACVDLGLNEATPGLNGADLGLNEAAPDLSQAAPDPDGPEEPKGITEAMARAMSGTGRAIRTLRPDLLMVLGDRYEAFCAVAAAHATRLPVAHIHGGELTQGVMDDAFRHSMTKMSHLHFTACDAYRRRVIQLGESPERVWTTGALGVENARLLPVPDEKTVRAHLGISSASPYILCTFHPVTLEAASPVQRIQELCAALEEFTEHTVVFTGANADAGGSLVNDFLQTHAAGHPRRRFFPSLGQARYFSAVRHAACVIGNSSSGIIEVPSFGTSVVDIGDRQKGRIRSAAVLHCDHEIRHIAQTLRRALEPESGERARTASNPYEREHTAQTIVNCVCSFPLKNILQKSFHDLSSTE